MFLSPFYVEKALIVQRINNNKTWARVMSVEANKYNKYNNELVGIIEFYYPQSLN
jgi:hypothetical protein